MTRPAWQLQMQNTASVMHPAALSVTGLQPHSLPSILAVVRGDFTAWNHRSMRNPEGIRTCMAPSKTVDMRPFTIAAAHLPHWDPSCPARTAQTHLSAVFALVSPQHLTILGRREAVRRTCSSSSTGPGSKAARCSRCAAALLVLKNLLMALPLRSADDLSPFSGKTASKTLRTQLVAHGRHLGPLLTEDLVVCLQRVHQRLLPPQGPSLLVQLPPQAPSDCLLRKA